MWCSSTTEVLMKICQSHLIHWTQTSCPIACLRNWPKPLFFFGCWRPETGRWLINISSSSQPVHSLIALFEDGALTQRRSSLPNTIKKDRKKESFLSADWDSSRSNTLRMATHGKAKEMSGMKETWFSFPTAVRKENLIWTFPCVYNPSRGTGTDERNHIHTAITFSRQGGDETSPKQPSASAKRTSGIMSFDSRVAGEAGCCQETYR